MECSSLDCEVCQENFKVIGKFKKHVRSFGHRKKMGEVFQKDSFHCDGVFPHIVLLDPKANKDFKQPILGLSLLTLCFSPGTRALFYLCHCCEEKCPAEKITSHISSQDHCTNFFSYTNPNVLSYSWMPSMDMRVTMKAEITKELNETGSGRLKMLNLPLHLLTKLERSTYPEVMSTLSQNDKLLELMKAVKSKRTMIQAYQGDKNRKHPLLGMQHLVECISVGMEEKRYYLCTLCNLTLGTHMIIRHVLSFDHIYCYFKAWHPSTLLSKECYKSYNNTFVSIILDYAKQTEEIHGTSNAVMKQVSVEPARFTSVNFTCYAEALKVLESITEENNENSLITTIKPGNKLERPLFLCKLRCQDCNIIFQNISEYKKHLSKDGHKRMLIKYFPEGETNGNDQKVHIPSLGLYIFLKEKWKVNQPAIGAPLVVTCICSQAMTTPLYLCFACHDCFTESLLKQHFHSQKHLIQTLLHQNPWRLPFAWKNHLELTVLKSSAWEEEKERGPEEMMIKVFDIPYWMFRDLLPSYPKVMSNLDQHRVLLKREVPLYETNSRHKQNERFPVLGQQFLVMHKVCVKRHESTEKSFLCLLCERRLSEEEYHTHVFSWEHVKTFLDRFHPGSINSSTDAETILDLAKQAARIHPKSHVQEVKLDKPIWEPCTYSRAISILKSAKKRERSGNLEPPIIPKMKLFPRKIVKDVDKGSVKENSHKSSDRSEMYQGVSEEAGAKITHTNCAETGGNEEKKEDKETSSLSEKESEKRREVSSAASSEELAGGKTCHVIRDESKQDPPISEQSGETIETFHSTDTTEVGEESIRGGKNVLTQNKNYIYIKNEKKRPRNMLESSEEDPCPNEDVEKENCRKKQRISSTQDVSHEETQNLLGSKEKEVTTTDKQGSGTPSHETSNDKESSNLNNQQAIQLWQYVKRTSREPVVGLGSLIECNCDQHDPIYLCECCSVKIPETDIISHVIGADHQKMYLVLFLPHCKHKQHMLGLQKLPPQPEKHQGKNIREMAALVEQTNGCGEAEVVDLDEEIYSSVSKQNFDLAIQTIKALQAQQGSCAEPPSTSALSTDQLSDSSVTLQAQHPHDADNFRVVAMKVEDGLEDSESQSSSETAAVFVISETTSKIKEHPLESIEDVKMTQIRESDSADKANNHPPASKSSEDASDPLVSTSGTNTACLHSDLNDLKAEIISNKTVEPLNIATTSKVAETLQYAAKLDSAFMTAPSKGPAQSSNSTSDTPKLTGTISTLKASTSGCATNTPTTSKSRQTDYKRAVTTPTVAAPTTKGITANPSCGTSSKTEKTSKYFETDNQTVAVSVKCENTEASVKTKIKKDSVGLNVNVAPNTPKSNTCTRSPQTGLNSEGSEDKNSPTEQSHTSTIKPKPMEGKPTLGKNQLIIVTCEGKRQIYCQLCSVRLKRSQHLVSQNHQFNYVNMTFPDWSAPLNQFKRKLDEMVYYLAEIEKDIGNLNSEILEVKNDMYKELAALPEDKALERIKAALKYRCLRQSSTSDAPKGLSSKDAFLSPSEASTPDDEICTPKTEMPEPFTNNHSEKRKRQVQEIESVSKNKGDLAAVPSDRAQSLKGSGPEANNQISDQLSLCSTSRKNKTVATSSIQGTDIAVNNKQETFGSDVKSQAKSEVTREMKSPDPPACNSESAARFTKIPDTFQGSAKKEKQQKKHDPVIQDMPTAPVHTQKTPPVKCLNTDPRLSAEQPRRPSQNAEYVAKHSGYSQGPGHSSASQSLSTGQRSQGSSNLSTYLDVMDLKLVIGLGLVWECRGGGKETLFLCESCEKTLISSDICKHMISDGHQFKYMVKQYPQFMWFWWEKNLNQNMKLYILKGVVLMLAVRESYYKMDAQVIQLREAFYDYIRTAPFSEALKMVQNIKKKPKLNCLPISSLQQNETRQKTAKHRLEETAVVGNLNRIKQRGVLSPLDVTSVSSKANYLVSPVSGSDKCHSPQETSRSLSMEPELRPPVSQHQRPCTEVQVKQAVVHSESPSSSIVSPKANQTLSVSPRDNCCSTRKRQADTPLETLVEPCLINPHLDDPVPAKCRHISQQSVGQSSTESACGSTPFNPAATSMFPSPGDKDAGPGSDEQGLSNVGLKYNDLISIVKMSKSFRLALNNTQSTTASANSSSESVSERTWVPNYAHASFKMGEKQISWDSKGSQNNAAVNNIPPSTDSLEGLTSAAAPVDLGCRNQLSQPASNAYLPSSAVNSSPEGCSARGHLLLRESKAKAAGTMFPSTTTTKSSDPQHQKGDSVQIPDDHTETQSTYGRQFPINSIITARKSFTNRHFMGSYDGREPTNVSMHVAHRVPTALSSDTLVASGGICQQSQMAFVPNGHSAAYATPNNPPAYTRNLYPQVQGYTTGAHYSSHISPGHQVYYTGHNLAASVPLSSVSMEVQPQIQQQQQLLMQQQYLCTSANLATAGGQGTHEEAHIGTVPLSTSADRSQFIYLDSYRTV